MSAATTEILDIIWNRIAKNPDNRKRPGLDIAVWSLLLMVSVFMMFYTENDETKAEREPLEADETKAML